MTLTKEETKTLKDNWGDVQTQLNVHFPGITNDELDGGPDPAKIARKGDLDEAAVEGALRDIALRYQSGIGDASAGQAYDVTDEDNLRVSTGADTSRRTSDPLDPDNDKVRTDKRS